MSYQKTNWVNGYTPLNASNMNKIEEGIFNNDTFLSSLDIRVNTLEGSIGQGGIASVNISGNGNALNNASYDPSTKILNFEKNNTFALDSDLDSVNDKNLYHLGAFDSVSGNIITRQTGYLSPDDIVKENILIDTTFTNTRFYFVVSDIEKSTIIPPFLVKWNLKGDDGSVLSNTNYTSICNYNATIYIRINDNGDVINNLNDLKKYILSHNVSIQYKLATSYTEEIIEDKPLNTLDQSGSQWIREEWEKGLNLYHKEDYSISAYGQSLVARGSSITLNGTNTKGSDNFLPFNPFSDLEVNKVYTLKLSNTTGYILECWIGDVQYRTDTNGLLTIYLTSEIKTNNDWRISARANSSFNNTLINIMLVEGSHAYPYQEYKGQIVREKELNDQLVKVKIFSGDTSTFSDFTSWIDSNNERVISIMYYERSSGGNNYYNVIFGSDGSVYKYIDSEGTLNNVTLSSGSEGADILKIYYI